MTADDQEIPADIFNVLTETRHGQMLVNRNDRYVGQSLMQYGEMCEGEAPGVMMAPVPEPRVSNNFGGLSLNSGDHGEAVDVVPIDSLQLQRLRLIKADVEGMEAAVVAGARDTITRCRPFLYLENDRADKSAELIGLVLSLGYRTPLFKAENFRGNRNYVFGATVSINMFCQPAETARPVAGMREIQHVAERWSGSGR